MFPLPTLLRFFALGFLFPTSLLYADSEVFSGPAANLPAPISERRALVDFKADFRKDAPRELRLILREAITLTDIEKQGIKGGGGVREVPVKVFGNLNLLIPVKENKIDYAQATAEVQFLGVNRIGFKGPIKENPENPLKLEAGRVTGSLLFPAAIKEPKQSSAREVELVIQLELEIREETFEYTPDADPSIPPWRSDKTQPSGNKVAGTWKTVERRADSVLELEGKIAGARGCYRLRPTVGSFFPVQAIEFAPGPKGLAIKAFSSPYRVDSHESQWVVKQLENPLDLREFNGIRLAVESKKPMAGRSSTGPAPVAAAVAIRMKGERWFACRTVAPLLGGRQEFVVDFELFARGTANPGIGTGPNVRNILDLEAIDAVAVGVANPFGVGTVEFEALELEAVRYRKTGNGAAPAGEVVITVDPRRRDEFNGVSNVPKGLFGYHLANPSFLSEEAAPEWFDAAPVQGDGMKLLEICRPGSLRPLDHTNFTPETGAGMVQILPASIATKGEALDEVMNTITNENLWGRPKWMDVDLETYANGIQEMFRQVGEKAWTPEKPENTLRRIEFWNEPFMWARHVNRGSSTLSAGPGDPGGNRGRKAWNDATQFTYMPGKLGGEIYSKFFNAAVTGLRSSNPHVKIGGMSSGSFGDDFCSQLTNYVDHFLAGSKDQIDFLTEHHYNSNPVRFAADYEIVTAWSLAKYGKSWPIWNTETNDLDDVAPGDKRSPEAAKAFTDRNRAYYNFRDILEMLISSRDVAAGRAIHALWGRGWFKNEGEFLMYQHTAALRGTLVSTSSPDPKMIAASAWENGSLSIYLLNDSGFNRSVRLEVSGVAGGASVQVLGLGLNSEASEYGSREIQATLDGSSIRLSEPLTPFEIVKITIPNQEAPSLTKATRRYFSDVAVADILPGKTRSGKIPLPKEAFEKATTAKLRVIFRDVQTGEASIRIGAGSVRIPATTSDDGQHRVVDLPIPIKPQTLLNEWKDGKIPVTFECDEKSDGYTAYALGLVLTES